MGSSLVLPLVLFVPSSVPVPVRGAGERGWSRSLCCAQMHGGACAGLGSQQRYMCDFFIYTHNQFIISSQKLHLLNGKIWPAERR